MKKVHPKRKKGGKMVMRYKNSIYQVGYSMDHIYISEELASRNGRRFMLKCNLCGKEKKVFLYQISTGKWDVCEHDVL